MIQSKELRIGNLVGIGENALHADGGKNQIYEISELKTDVVQFKMFHSGEYYKDLAPIPLTEEWLLQFGFEKIKSDEYPHKFIINKYMSYEVEIENLNSQNCFVFSHGKKFSKIKIEYVHQLQNIHFSLTGKELPF